MVLDPKGEQVLLVLNSAGTWGFPGAKSGDGETLEQAAIRGIFELTGLSVEVDRVAAVGEFIQTLSELHHLFVLFAAHAIAGQAEPQGRDDAVELRWATPEQADWLVPWYPGGVQRLLESREAVYYAHEGFE
jgi:8-oxo-dGTP diphosphatase